MRVYLFVLILFNFSYCLAQDSTKVKKHKLGLGIDFSPNYCFRSLSNNDGSSNSDIVINNRENYEIPHFGYNAGVNVHYNLFKFFQIQTGVSFVNCGYDTKWLEINYFDRNNLVAVYGKGKFKYIYKYISVPLKFDFLFGNKKLKAKFGVGTSADFFIEEKVRYIVKKYDGNKEVSSYKNRRDNYKNLNISLLISSGIDYKVRRLHITAQPIIRYGLLKIIDAPVTARLWNAGIDLGLIYDL